MVDMVEMVEMVEMTFPLPPFPLNENWEPNFFSILSVSPFTFVLAFVKISKLPLFLGGGWDEIIKNFKMV